MAPKGKSSATSATRKKHARKAATAHGVVEEPQMPKEKKPKGKDKKSKKAKEIDVGSAADRWGGEVSIMDIEYKKRGTTREWDMGKEGF